MYGRPLEPHVTLAFDGKGRTDSNAATGEADCLGVGERTMTLEFRWSVSRGRDTYGYNICTLTADGRKVARCNGGGYDMKGSCFGDFIAKHYADRLLALKPEDMPEQSHWKRDECAYICRDDECFGNRIAADLPLIKAHTDNWADPAPKCPECGHEMSRDHRAGERVDEGRYFYGLCFINPNYDPGEAVVAHAPVFGKDEDAGKTVAVLEDEGKSLGLERYQAFYAATSKHPTEMHTVPSIDGACGMSSVEQIAKAIGLTLEYVPTKGKNSVYILRDSRA
jgi:hypothetical protein